MIKLWKICFLWPAHTQKSFQNTWRKSKINKQTTQSLGIQTQDPGFSTKTLYKRKRIDLIGPLVCEGLCSLASPRGLEEEREGGREDCCWGGVSVSCCNLCCLAEVGERFSASCGSGVLLRARSFHQYKPPLLLDCPPSEGVACLKSMVIHMSTYELCSFLWKGKHKISEKHKINRFQSSKKLFVWILLSCSIYKMNQYYSYSKKGYCQILLRLVSEMPADSYPQAWSPRSLACLFSSRAAGTIPAFIVGSSRPDYDLQVWVLKVALLLKGI